MGEGSPGAFGRISQNITKNHTHLVQQYKNLPRGKASSPEKKTWCTQYQFQSTKTPVVTGFEVDFDPPKQIKISEKYLPFLSLPGF